MNALLSPVDDQTHIEAFLNTLWLEEGLSANTRAAYGSDIAHFAAWLHERGKALVGAVRADILGFLAACTNTGMHARSSARMLSSLRRFYRLLLRQSAIHEDPTCLVASPKTGRSLPKILSEHDVNQLLATPNVGDVLGLRDKAMLELFYASGLRVSELVQLELSQIGLQQGVIRVVGKGNKERLVPMGEEAQHWVARYLREARPQLLGGVSSDVLLISRRAQAMTRQTCWHRIKKLAKLCGIHKALSPHTLRHAFATHLVNHGADLRTVQMLLGHSDLSTTQIYTFVAQERLKSLHAQHHPRG